MNFSEEVKSKVEYEFSHRYNYTLHAYIDIAGDLISGTLLSQIMYWFSDNKSGKKRVRVFKDGYYWLAKGRDEWMEEIRISKKQYDNAIEKLRKRGLVKTKLYKFNSVPTTHIRPIYENINSEVNKWKHSLAEEISSFTKTVNPDLPKGENGNSPNGKIEFPQRDNSITGTTNNDYITEDYNTETVNKKASTKVEVNKKALPPAKEPVKLPYNYSKEQFAKYIQGKVASIVEKNQIEIKEEESETIAKIISFFYDTYFDKTGERHPILSDIAYTKVIMEFLEPPEVIRESGIMFDFECYKAMILRFFNTEYGKRSGAATDYRLPYFMSDTVRENLYYKELY